MNYKLEKFWNKDKDILLNISNTMNYKLEKFWNLIKEMLLTDEKFMNYKLEKFWNEEYIVSNVLKK